MLVLPTRRMYMVAGVILIAAVFLALRLPGLDLPYHQDEWKNVSASATVEGAGAFFAHPPLMQMIFVAGNALVGTDGMRLVPLLFSVGAAVLLFMVVDRRAGRGAAWWSVVLFAVCAYNIHGSLSPDVDGAILPFFFLLALFAYDRWLMNIGQAKWFIFLVVVLLIGLLTKLSFIIVIGVFIADYLWQNRNSLTLRKISLVAGASIGFVAVYVALLYLFQVIYPAFSISLMLGHAKDSAGDIGRNWVQIVVQSAKAVYFLSPLLIVPLVFMSRDVWNKARPFFLYIAFGLLFYLVIFDFSRTVLDKYLLFLIVPLAAIVGIILSGAVSASGSPDTASSPAGAAPSSRPLRAPKCPPSHLPLTALIIGILISAALVALNFLPHETVALYPKTEWFSRVLHGEWNILNPFTGGNGPMGFYVSFLFIAASFIVSGILAVISLIKKDWRSSIAVILVLIGLSYNAVFAEEMLYGKINGSAPTVLRDSISYIGLTRSITEVLTYNDIGAGLLSQTGKYAGRFYAAPDFEEGHKQKFNQFDGHYLVVDIPRLYDGFYSEFFAKCQMLFQSRSQNITGRVYDCQL